MAESALSILSTSPTGSPQSVQDRQPCGGMDVCLMPGFFQPAQQMKPQPSQKPSRDGGGRNTKQRAGQGGQGRGPVKQATPTSRNAAKNMEITQQPPPWTGVTTVMMRNLPNKYTQHMLLDELQVQNFRLQQEIDFFYLPMDHTTAVNLGYCFINFVEPCVANAFAACFQGRRMRHFNSQKTIVVMPASMQGFDKNYGYYASKGVCQAEDPQYRPIFARQPACQEASQFQPVAAVMWTPPPNPPYSAGWTEPWAQQPYVGMPAGGQDLDTDDEREQFGTHAGYQGGCDEVKREPAKAEEPHEVFSPRRSQRLLIRNTFLAVPERSPSVERCLERQCKSAPVSAPHSAVGSARIELDELPRRSSASGLDFAVVAAANCLAMDLGCVAVEQDAGTNPSSNSGSLRMTAPSMAGSTTADSERGQCGSGDFPADSDGMAILGSPQFPCKGSALHKLGSCKPCAFHAQGGDNACKNGVECKFCHLCEPGEKKRRKKEKKEMKRDFRDKLRQVC